MNDTIFPAYPAETGLVDDVRDVPLTQRKVRAEYS